MYEHTLRKPDGVVILTDAEGGIVEHDTKACNHCGGHFIVTMDCRYCFKCSDIVCSKPRCVEHFEIEEKLDLVEAGKMPLISL